MPKFPFGDIGPAEIVWGYDESGAMYLGKTLGGIHPVMVSEGQTVHEDQWGSAVLDRVPSGEVVTVECTFTRLTPLQIATLLDVEVDGGGQRVRIKSRVGCPEYERARSLVIKPICEGVVSTDPAEWIFLSRAFPIPGFDFMFDPTTQRTMPITFTIFVSQESGWVGEYGSIGMPAGSPAL